MGAAGLSGRKPMNTSRLNIVGEGRAGKTAFLGACRGKPFSATDSTIGVEQILLEVNRVDLESNDRGGMWLKMGTDQS